MRQFVPSWFKGQFSRWLEYSVKKDAAYCLCCYLFKNKFIHGSAGEFYTKNGFRAWNKSLERLRLNVGDVNSVRDKCFKKDIINAYAKETLKAIIGDLNGD